LNRFTLKLGNRGTVKVARMNLRTQKTGVSAFDVVATVAGVLMHCRGMI